MGFNITVRQLGGHENNSADETSLVLFMESKIDCTSRIPIFTFETAVTCSSRKVMVVGKGI